jgi:small redox-active disulfide protein 2
MKRIEVLGPGCAKCQRLLENVRDALAQVGVEAEVVKVEDVFDIASRGCQRTPGLIVDGKVRLQGRVATVNEIKEWLTE